MNSSLMEEIVIKTVSSKITGLALCGHRKFQILPYGSKSTEVKNYLCEKYPQIDLSQSSSLLEALEKRLVKEEQKINKLEKEIGKKIKASFSQESQDSPNSSLLHTLLNDRYLFEEDNDKDEIKTYLCRAQNLNFVESRRLQNALMRLKDKFCLGKKIITVMGTI